MLFAAVYWFSVKRFNGRKFQWIGLNEGFLILPYFRVENLKTSAVLTL